MKNQTAVEWLEEEINKRGPKENNPPQWLKELYGQAKSMEKEQIKNAFGNIQRKSGYDKKGNFVISDITAENYYEKTYGKDNV